MNRFGLYRRLRGGHWIYNSYDGWCKVTKLIYQVQSSYRSSGPHLSFENYTKLPDISLIMSETDDKISLSGTMTARLGKYGTLELDQCNCSNLKTLNLTAFELQGLRELLNKNPNET